MLNEPDGQRFAIIAAPDPASSFTVFRIDPGDAIDNEQRVDVVTHRAASLDDSTLGAGSSFLFARCHWSSKRRLFRGDDLVTLAFTQLLSFGIAIRSICMISRRQP